MNDKNVAPYGSWKSPITADLITSTTTGLLDIVVDGEVIYWTEVRPEEGGRYVIVRRTPDGKTTDMNPAPFNARTRVHEYGGGAFTVIDGAIYFTNYSDQRIYRLNSNNLLSVESDLKANVRPDPITAGAKMRYADLHVDRLRNRLLCVREDHTGTGEAVNTIVAVDLNQAGESGDVNLGQVLVSGNDFYSSPRLNPDGNRLAWLTWNHPNMPWDGTELWVADVEVDGSLTGAHLVAGGVDISIFQPEWSPGGELFFVSDQTNWWNLYRYRQGESEPLWEKDAEFGVPHWVFGLSTYAFVDQDQIVCSYSDRGLYHLVRLNLADGTHEAIDLPYTYLSHVRAFSSGLVFIAAAPTVYRSVVLLSFDTGSMDILRCSSRLTVDSDYLSVPEAIEFPTGGSVTAHAFYYRPKNRDYEGPPDQKPPLIVVSHGGPTGEMTAVLNLNTQYWTSRGFAVIDVNYGGSSGYGRAYRERLKGQWGVVDVEDCLNGAKYLVERDEVDRERIAIRGGSAGGYTTLCALAFRDFFAAGASYFGLSELEIFVKDTHKFESQYLVSLVGPYPEKASLYRERSPINYVDHISCPLILFQGLEDKIVPPNQSEIMLEAVRKKGLPVAYVPFEGEQHGFRRAESIKRALEAELYFYGKVFEFQLVDQVEPTLIHNL